MAIIEMIMPKMGESIMEGTILRWLKQVGDSIKQDEPVLEVATDKVDTEVPATHAGVLTEILVKEGEVVAIGRAIARISTEASLSSQVSDAPLQTPPQAQPLADTIQVLEHSLEVATQYANGAKNLAITAQNRFYSPLVLSIAKEENISSEELVTIQGTGADNRVTKKDILAYVAYKKSKPTPIAEPTPKIATQAPAQVSQEVPKDIKPVAPATSYSGAADIVEMDRMRKMIAQRMVDSKRISPHVTTFVEVDVTNIVQWRNAVKDAFKKREGENITFTPIFIQAIAKALKDFPVLNSSVEGENIIIKKDINIGMATALPSGNLIVPVIKNADHYNLVGLTKKVNDLAQRARGNKLSPEDLSNGTYTLSNIGSFGNEMGTPIIMQPQVAIMAFGTIKKKPAVIETPQGDFIGIRQLMFISHAYDHRIIDGALGGSFARRVADYLENFDVNTTL